MGRGIGLGCEQCDFAATLYERQPFALDTTGQPYALAREAAVAPSGYWTDGLCGACRLPVRTAHTGPAPALDGAAMTCPRCGAPALTFEQALHELAAASRSRVWLDLRHEQAAAGRLEAALRDVPQLRTSIAAGEMTTLEALDALAADLTPPTTGATPALDGVGALLENALDLDAAMQVLRMRLEESQSHAGALELVAEDEAHLPGVPCPQCETGHLIHWPIWE